MKTYNEFIKEAREISLGEEVMGPDKLEKINGPLKQKNVDHLPDFHSAISQHPSWKHTHNIISHLDPNPGFKTTRLTYHPVEKPTPKKTQMVGHVYHHDTQGKMTVGHLGWSHRGKDEVGRGSGPVSDLEGFKEHLKKTD